MPKLSQHSVIHASSRRESCALKLWCTQISCKRGEGCWHAPTRSQFSRPQEQYTARCWTPSVPRPFSWLAKATQQPRGFIIILTLFLNTTHTVLCFQLVFLLFTTWYTAYKTFNFVWRSIATVPHLLYSILTIPLRRLPCHSNNARPWANDEARYDSWLPSQLFLSKTTVESPGHMQHLKNFSGGTYRFCNKNTRSNIGSEQEDR